MKPEHDPIHTIEYEVAVLMRRAEHARSNDPAIGSLDRSAYLLLRQLNECGTAGVKALADAFQLTISTVSRQAAALEAKGLVKRLPDPEDGRVSLFQITPLGSEQLQEVQQARFERYAEILHDWSDDDRERFGELLERFNKRLFERRR